MSYYIKYNFCEKKVISGAWTGKDLQRTTVHMCLLWSVLLQLLFHVILLTTLGDGHYSYFEDKEVSSGQLSNAKPLGQVGAHV